MHNRSDPDVSPAARAGVSVVGATLVSPSSPAEEGETSLAPTRRDKLVSLPVWLVVLLCSGLPLAWLLLTIVTNPHVLRDAWPDLFRAKLLGRTLLYNGATALIAGAMGVPVGLVLGRGRGVV